jgi:hypothetical protein
MNDTGNAMGPLVVAAVAAVSLSGAVVAAGALGLLASAGIARWAPRYSPFATVAMVRARLGEPGAGVAAGTAGK